MERILLSAAFDFVIDPRFLGTVRKIYVKLKNGGQECPPHTFFYYCNGGGVIPTNVVPVNFPWAVKFQVKMAEPARAQAWHPLISG